MRIRDMIVAVSLVALAVGSSPALAASSNSTLPAGLTQQAHRLYAPVRRYERSLTRRQRARLRSAASRAGAKIAACTNPYIRRLDKPSKTGQELYRLWNDAETLEISQADMRPAAKSLTALAGAWKQKHLSNRVMNNFIHGLSGEMRLTLTSVPLNTCKFTRRIAAHNFSYAWASRSSYGKEAMSWWRSILKASGRTNSFWLHLESFVPTVPPRWAGLFTRHQLLVLANLPGEAG